MRRVSKHPVWLGLFLLIELSLSAEVIFRESFDQGAGGWTTGKNKTHTRGETWHRNILGFYGEPASLTWSPSGGRSGGYATAESPWYFDDNHGEFGWLYLVFGKRTGWSTYPLDEEASAMGRDVRNATVRISLRGRDMRLQGTRFYYWNQAPPATGPWVYRCWALTSVPLEGYLTDGNWHDVSFKLDPHEGKWSYMGLINGGLRKRIRVIQSLSFGQGTLEEVLGDGKLYNWGFILVDVDPLDPPSGKIDIDQFSITLDGAE